MRVLVTGGAGFIGSALARYLAGELGAQNIGRFDLVTAMEVVEHVADKRAFLAVIAAHLAPDVSALAPFRPHVPPVPVKESGPLATPQPITE